MHLVSGPSPLHKELYQLTAVGDSANSLNGDMCKSLPQTHWEGSSGRWRVGYVCWAHVSLFQKLHTEPTGEEEAVMQSDSRSGPQSAAW